MMFVFALTVWHCRTGQANVYVLCFCLYVHIRFVYLTLYICLCSLLYTCLFAACTILLLQERTTVAASVITPTALPHFSVLCVVSKLAKVLAVRVINNESVAIATTVSFRIDTRRKVKGRVLH
ncbi:hypothetical protein, unlikely [Trypanosoma brucei gambiense DAL972]|uniref:T. brucei spp.-specific protein n=1 Tax=Trypanosoma brucei gambiense (strain MHOM/CI/86/DAL972) TaxID=679716 RepID=D0A3B1_TRYB9|nr:hypothetical protein, unlikely [Trypanosoma brucei gambiense DAL972]CBH15755.1 hypothetical protein, unlikely [Trypanosoma brucei gambiense DAL972]|eukprot:XP_011778019.1 hypothetical protein, unlikely [Trypanosoma brucei gambiense DAL972]